MNEPTDKSPSETTAQPDTPVRRSKHRWFPIRGEIGLVVSIVLGVSCVVFLYGAWWFLTRGEIAEERIIGPQALPSPSETFETFSLLWTDRKLLLNTWTTLRRVTIGFALASLVGIPMGVLAGCFPPVKAFLTPMILFGRNIPIAALVPLTFFFFGIGEYQKIIFIFLACVAFVVADTATSISNVGQQYLDTAYTLGANRWQSIVKVLVPLAMPAVFDSLRLLFGLAFGYIMLAETIKLGSESGGLGNLILTSQRIGPRAHIYLIILIIPIVAFVLDRLLFLVQKGLFPHKYGGNGWALYGVRMVAHGLDDLKGLFFRPSEETEWRS
ncbi:Bicarbonate transport system permease protein CmpB [Planctomycetes bacterium CA13]|uniref:Bicarbonate transport system permease protein CmpB n=1 Tax=Novipirellula herctigrandis TaxID=2527986 RepID=A0A5C5Z5Y9_9BACT|nr:Bicarbonate transport system permease protein CmpB [Planctomycetes bacterium CA13]